MPRRLYGRSGCPTSRRQFSDARVGEDIDAASSTTSTISRRIGLFGRAQLLGPRAGRRLGCSSITTGATKLLLWARVRADAAHVADANALRISTAAPALGPRTVPRRTIKKARHRQWAARPAEPPATGQPALGNGPALHHHGEEAADCYGRQHGAGTPAQQAQDCLIPSLRSTATE